MNFLRHKDNIINLERITRIYKKEIFRERPTGFGLEAEYRIVFVGDGQEIEIKCNSSEEAEKIIDILWEIIKKCSQCYCF